MPAGRREAPALDLVEKLVTAPLLSTHRLGQGKREGGMYLKRIILENIKAFEKADIDLCPEGASYAGWSVITGDNGSGKTAFLKAISLAILGPEQSRGLVPDLSGWVTVGRDSGSASVEIKPDHEHDKTAKGGYRVQ